MRTRCAVSHTLAPIYSARDVPLALATIIKATAAGELTTGEAANLAALLGGVDPGVVNVKAKTHEKVDSLGEGRSVAVHAVVLLVRQ